MGTQGRGHTGGGDEGCAGDRLQRIEESLGFVEREQEQLGSQVVRLQQQVLALSQRVQQLEGSLERVVKRAADQASESPETP